MKILFLDQYSELGGAQQCLLDLMPAVIWAGWQPVVAVPGDGPLAGRLRDLRVEVESLPLGSYRSHKKSAWDVMRFAASTPRLALAIRRLVKRFEPDLIYVNGPRVLPAARMARTRRTPLLFHCHSRLTQPLAARAAGRSLRAARATVVSCCNFSVEPLRTYITPERLHVVYNGVAGPSGPSAGAPQLPRTRKPPGGGFHIGVVGRIAPEKGHADFLQAARLLNETLPNCRFVICGEALFADPVSKEYRETLDKLAGGLPVEFLGWRDDVYEVLARLDLLVVPSTHEPATTRVVLEAYSCGLPVVAYPTGGIPEVLSDGETGFFVQPMEPRALAERILTLVLSQPERLEQAAAAGHRLWSERFGIERYQLEMIKVLARAMGVEPPEAPGVKEQPTGATESPSNADDRDLGGAKQFRNAAG
jgi:glycosyltransferase involved in cell wall biosynthesis